MAHGCLKGIVYFGEFKANLSTGELFREEKRIRIQNVPFRVLEVLLRANGELVERERMLQEAWSGSHVGNRSINTAIRKLRYALGDHAAIPRLIETIGTRGHRLMVPVLFQHLEDSDIDAPPPTTIAVLPFQNLGDPKNDSFSRALTEQLIVQLGRLAYHLSIIVPPTVMQSCNSQKIVQLDGEIPCSEYMLDGSVLPGVRNWRITARLIRSSDHVCVWSESYVPRRWEVLLVQEDTTRQIAQAIQNAMLFKQSAPKLQNQ